MNARRFRAALAVGGALAAALAVAVPASASASASASAAATVVGTGTPGSCTSAAVIAAVARGGTIRFDCGAAPVTIAMAQTAKVLNTSASVVIDGGGTVTLSGEGARRVLYMDTCDRAQGITTPHCQQQPDPHLVLQNLTIEHGVSAGDGATGGGGLYAFGGRLTIEHSTFLDDDCAPASGDAVGGGAVAAAWQDHAAPVQVSASHFSDDVCDNGGVGGGGGAIFATQNRLAITGSTFSSNSCPQDGPDVGGGAVRAFIETGPVLVSGSSFTGNVCSNGGALSSIGASWAVKGDRFSANQAIGNGANPPAKGTPGGGSGGAIYNDGEAMHLAIDHSTFTGNRANEGGGAIFFVSDNHKGTMSITDSRLVGNPNAGFQSPGLPGIFYIGDGPPTIRHSVLRP